MKTDFHMDKLKEVCIDFYNATGIAIYISVADVCHWITNKAPVCKYCEIIRKSNDAHRECAKSDAEKFALVRETGKPQVYNCHGGMLNIIVPIFYEDTIQGLICAYNIRRDDFSLPDSTIEKLEVTKEEMCRLYDSVTKLSDERIESVIRLLALLAKHFIESNMIVIDSGTNIRRVKDYINQNIDKNLTVKSVSEGTNISKSSIYRLFERHLGCTLSEYINSKRIDLAEKLLVRTELSIEEVAKRTGFSSTVYFRSIFKNLKGTSPLKYRKSKKEIEK